MDGPARARYWKAWLEHCRLYPDNHRGNGIPPANIDDMFFTFAVAVREGKFGLGRQVKVQSVAVALRSVAQKYVLDGHPDPRRASPAQHALDLPIACILKRFDDEDPAPKPKLTVPVSTITAIATKYNFTKHHAAVADMVVIAFFYLLRVGEYTLPSNTCPKHTIPLQKCEVQLWRRGTILDHTAALSTLLRADSATISIANTKNGTKGAFVHNYAIGGAICPVAALARRISNLSGQAPTTPLSTVIVNPTTQSTISDRDITTAVRWGATYDCLLARGYTLDRVSSHSLRAGGAMAMKLSGASDSTIMRIRRWTSLTYLTYIHSQIGALAKEVAWKMSKCFHFQNVS
jgi:hypothetical protein